MADALKRLYFGQPTTSNTTLYTAPGSTNTVPAAVVRTIHAANTSGTSATLTLALNGTAATAANQILGTFSIPAYGLLVENVNIVLNETDTIQGLQGTSGAITLVVSGVTL